MGDKRSDMGFQSENKKEKTNDDNDQNQCYETMSCDEKQSQPWNKSDSRNRSQNEQNPNLSKNALAVAEPPNDESSARMFTLNIDCLEELFEWLSIKDLFTLRQTCKRLKKVADYYIKTNYPKIGKFSLNGQTFKKLLGMDLNSINLIKEIDVSIGPDFDASQFVHIKDFLNKIQYIYIRGWKSDPNIYDVFLKYCNNMKLLLLENFQTIGCVIISNEWLRHQYPSLEYVHIENMPKDEIDEFVRFFRMNPNIHAISVDFNSLVENALHLSANGITFERLYIFMLIRDEMNLLPRLYDEGFYKRLNLADTFAVNEEIRNIPSTGTQTLHLHRLYFVIPPLPNLKELRVVDPRQFDGKYEYAKDTVERVYIGTNISVNMETYKTTTEQVFAFIQNCPKLKHFMISHLLNESALNLIALNKERKKLAGACKTTIYVEDKVFIATKWAKEKTNYDLIELKRHQARDWALNFENDPCGRCVEKSMK